jgi:hypothetical protein
MLALALSYLPVGFAGGEAEQSLLYRGLYQVRLSDAQARLHCRTGPHPEARVRLSYPNGSLVDAVERIETGSGWFKTAEGCFIPASGRLLQWRGEGEDPSTMCDPRTEPC